MLVRPKTLLACNKDVNIWHNWHNWRSFTCKSALAKTTSTKMAAIHSVNKPHCIQDRPYNDDNTASRLLSEVKHHLARLVLRWGTTLESLVLIFCCYYLFSILITYYLCISATHRGLSRKAYSAL